jgi:hypothetical protein
MLSCDSSCTKAALCVDASCDQAAQLQQADPLTCRDACAWQYKLMVKVSLASGGCVQVAGATSVFLFTSFLPSNIV